MMELPELTKEEIEAFQGLNDSYIEMDEKMKEVAPKCHFRPMFYDECEGEEWWECSVCGHTKEIR